MSEVTFETATISDVLKKAARVAPKHNAVSLASAPGIYIHILDDGEVIVRSTDMEVFLTQWTGYIEKVGPATEWHIASSVADLCGYLPNSQGNTVTFKDENGLLTVTSKKTVATMPMITNFDYPKWEAFDESNSTPVSNMGARIEQVLWACAKETALAPVEYSGILFTGESITASNTLLGASVPLECSTITRPITVPSKSLAFLTKHAGDVLVTLEPKGIGISPDDHTQVFVRIFGSNPVTKMNRRTDFEHTTNVNSEQMTSVLQRMIAATKGAENPVVKLFFANGEVLMRMTGKTEAKTISDVVEIPGFAMDHAAMLQFDPELLLAGMAHAPSHTVELHYDASKPSKVMYMKCGDYEAWFGQKWEQSK